MSAATEHPVLGTCRVEVELPPVAPPPVVRCVRTASCAADVSGVVAQLLGLLERPEVLAAPLPTSYSSWHIIVCPELGYLDGRLVPTGRYAVHLTLSAAQAEAAGVLAPEVGP